MDGVIVDSEPVILKAAILGLKEFGVTAQPKDFEPFIGAGEDRYIGGVAEKYGVKYKYEMKKRVYDLYDEIVDDHIELMVGAKELLNDLKSQGYKLALASSADMRKIKSNLKAVNINTDNFDVVVSGEDVENKKPSPDIYFKAASKLCEKPSNCIVVEDAINGIEAAKSAEMKCIAVTSSFSKEILEKSRPNFICSDLSSIIKYVNCL
jgi:HAD superfamily hydrolase (TIGR01509 family)